MSSLSNLPLQEMINGVIRSATTKMAAHPEDWAVKQAMDVEKTAMCGSCGGKVAAGDKCACMTKSAALTDPSYIEKLASACDFIAGNVHNIEAPNRGVLGNAIAKVAGESVPPTNPNGALEAQASMAGEQTYKKDKPKPGYDAAASTAGTPEGTAGLPGGATQMHNDMESAPGQSSGSVPTAQYPAAGVLHAGPTKTAGLQALLAGLQDGSSEKTASAGTELATNSALRRLLGRGRQAASAVGDTAVNTAGKVDTKVMDTTTDLLRRMGKAPKSAKTVRALGYGVPAAGVGAAGLGAKAALGKEKDAAAGTGLATNSALRRLLGQSRQAGAAAIKGVKGAPGKIDAAAIRAGKKITETAGRTGEGAAAYMNPNTARIIGYGVPAAGVGAAGLTAKALAGKEKSAGDLAREAILSKLAGEDVMKAKISSGTGGGALVGDGELDVLTAPQVPTNPTDGSGYGNQQRGMIASNQAATDYTKGGAKKPRASELAEVLRNPAFSPKHDGKLQEQLQNTGAAGVKIAGAQMRGLLKQAAIEGLITQEMVDNIKIASAEGCSCGGQGSCRSCKLESLKNDAQKTSQVPPPPMGGGSGGPVGGMGGSF